MLISDTEHTNMAELLQIATYCNGIYIVEERWKSLKDISADRMLALQEMVSDIQKFQASHEDLSQWLTQKDKMVTLMGPLAMEPSMVNTQTQQVQVCHYYHHVYVVFCSNLSYM